MSSIHPKLEALRPLRHLLRKGDQLFFLHIPKTAGTSVTNILQTQVKPEEFLSFPDEGSVKPEILALLQTARIIRGHRPYDFLRLFTRHPHVITMLRNPVDRMISNFIHLQARKPERLLHVVRRVQPDRGEERVTLEEYADAPAMQNLMLQYLAGAKQRPDLSDEDRPTPASMLPNARAGFKRLDLSDEDRLTLATVHLESLAFFGLKERFDDSMRLLAYTFYWPEFKKQVTLNTAPAGSKPPLSPEVRAALEAGNALDIQLYQYACALFDYRFQCMERELKGETL